MASKFNTWVNSHIGRGWDYDGSYGVQCYDLFNFYAHDFFAVPNTDLFRFNYAYELFSRFDETTVIKTKFTKIANTSSFIPQRGDVCIWKKSLNGKAGHVAIATGEGNTKYFYSYDQNWTGRNDAMSKMKHDYSNFYGVLRPKDQSIFKDTTPAKTAIGTILVVNKSYKVTAKSGIKIRSGAGTKYDVVGTAKKGAAYKLIEFLKVGNDIWGKISTKHWICVSQSGTLYVNATGTTTAALNYRNGAGTSYKILGTFKTGTKLTFVKTSGSWGYVSGKGWVSLNYIK